MTRRLAAVVAALACLPSAAALANPTVGVSFGKSQTEGDAAGGADPNSTLGLFARGRVSRVVQLQVELGKLQTDDYSGATIRTGNVAAIFDLGHGPLVPFVLVAAGLDVISQSQVYYDAYSQPDAKYVHGEAGIGLEYRFTSGFVLGADVRMGTRSQTGVEPLAQPGGVAVDQPVVAHFVASSSLSEGQYRSARLTLGVHF